MNIFGIALGVLVMLLLIGAVIAAHGDEDRKRQPRRRRRIEAVEQRDRLMWDTPGFHTGSLVDRGRLMEPGEAELDDGD